MKKLLSLMVVVMLVLVGCSKTDTEKDLVGKIKEAGVIKIGTNSGYPPYEFFMVKNGKKQLVGYDIDLGNKIAAELGVKAEFIDMEFDALVNSLKLGNIDIILAGMVNTEERRQSIDFSDAYVNSTLVAVMKKENVTKFDKVAKMNGAKIAVQVATTQEKAAQSIKGADVKSFPTVPDMVSAVKSGQADLLFIAGISADSLIAQNKDFVAIKTDIDKSLIEDGASVGIPKNQENLKTKINELLAKWEKDGTLAKLMEKNSKLAAELGE